MFHPRTIIVRAHGIERALPHLRNGIVQWTRVYGGMLADHLECEVMTQAMPFSQVLEAADHLSRDEQEELIAVLQRRLAQAARQRLAADIQEARQEFASGRCSPASPQEIMSEILK